MKERFGLAFFTFAAAVSILAAWEHPSLLAWLAALHNAILAGLYARRRPARNYDQQGLWLGLLAAVLPLAAPYLDEIPLVILIIGMLGYALVLWSLLVLGTRFGIAPADRGLVAHGPYRLVRHPMYLGELVLRLALVSVSPQPILSAGLFATLAGALAILLFGFLIMQGSVAPPVIRPQSDYILWLIGLLTFTIMGILLVVSISSMTDHLKKSRNERAQVARDLTQALEENIRQEQQFRLMIENATDIILILSEEGMLQYVSPSLKNILGYSPDQLIGRNVSEYLHPDSQSILQDFITRGSWPEEINFLEIRVRHADGTWRILEIRGKKTFSVEDGTSQLILNCRDITEHRLISEAFNAIDQLKEKAFSNLNDAVLILESENSTIIDCNQAASDIFGYPRQEMIGHSPDFLHVNAEYLEEFQQHLYRTVNEQGALSHFEFQLKRKDGSLFPSDHSVIPLEDSQGVRIGWVSIINDISTRKLAEKISMWELEQKKDQAEIALHQSESQLSYLFSGMMDAFFSSDMEGIIQDCNAAFSSMLGYDPQELKGKTRLSLLADRWHPIEKDVILNEVLARGYSEVHEKEMVRKNGETIPVELRTFVYTNEKGQRQGIWSIVRDISRRKQMESRLQRSEEMYRTLAEASQDMIFIIDTRDQVQYVNSYAAKSYGLRPEEMVGQPRSKFFASPEGDLQRASMQKVVETGQPLYREHPTSFPGGKVWLGTWLVPLKGPGGEITGILGVSRDISARIKIEQDLQKSEEMYRLLAEAARDVIYIINEEDTVIYVNSHGANIFNKKPDEIIGQPAGIRLSGPS